MVHCWSDWLKLSVERQWWFVQSITKCLPFSKQPRPQPAGQIFYSPHFQWAGPSAIWPNCQIVSEVCGKDEDMFSWCGQNTQTSHFGVVTGINRCIKSQIVHQSLHIIDSLPLCPPLLRSRPLQRLCSPVSLKSQPARVACTSVRVMRFILHHSPRSVSPLKS